MVDGQDLEFVFVPAGIFPMGCTKSELIEVQISRDFWMCSLPVTVGLWKGFMERLPSDNKKSSDDCPVIAIKWQEAAEFCNKLSEFLGLPLDYELKGGAKVAWSGPSQSAGVRLPTNAEWERAARAGREGPGESLSLGRKQWHRGNAEDAVHPVMSYKPSAWGFYDLGGNVWEYTWDWLWFTKDLTGPFPARDPVGPKKGVNKCVRGGSYRKSGPAKVSKYDGYTPSIRRPDAGFRVVMNELP